MAREEAGTLDASCVRDPKDPYSCVINGLEIRAETGTPFRIPAADPRFESGGSRTLQPNLAFQILIFG